MADIYGAIKAVDVIFKTGIVGLAVIITISITALYFRLQDLKDCITRIKNEIVKMAENHSTLDTRLDQDEKVYVLASVCVKNHVELNARLDREREDRIERHKEIMAELRLIQERMLDLKNNGHGKG